MSLRQQNLGSIIKPGFNPLGTQTVTYTYNLFTWGNNLRGQLGLGNTTDYSSPKQVGSTTGWSLTSQNSNSALAIKTDGTLWSWGYNAQGQLALGNTTNYSSLKQIGALTNWSQLASGEEHTIAVRTDGTLWAWGANGVGQLGVGNVNYYSSPKQVGLLTDWAYVGAGTTNSYAVKTDGTIWSWGGGTNGAIGNGSTLSRSSPVQIGALTNWLRVSGGANGAVAVKTDGTLWSWGLNAYGQLGLGNRTAYSSPKQVGLLTDWLYVTASTGEQCEAVKTNGTLWTWGRDLSGILGLGNTTNYSSPVQVGALTNWLYPAYRLSSSGFTMGATKTDGTLWIWGNNAYGQLGLGNTTYYSSPKQIGASTTWSRISAGKFVLASG